MWLCKNGIWVKCTIFFKLRFGQALMVRHFRQSGYIFWYLISQRSTGRVSRDVYSCRYVQTSSHWRGLDLAASRWGICYIYHREVWLAIFWNSIVRFQDIMNSSEVFASLRIVRTMLYILISGSPDRDIILHVSADNPAMVRCSAMHSTSAQAYLLSCYITSSDSKQKSLLLDSMKTI